MINSVSFCRGEGVRGGVARRKIDITFPEVATASTPRTPKTERPPKQAANLPPLEAEGNCAGTEFSERASLENFYDGS